MGLSAVIGTETMLRTSSQSQTRIGIQKSTAEILFAQMSTASSCNLCVKNYQDKISLNKIETHGSKLSTKSSAMFRLFCQSVNGLSTDCKSWKFSHKHNQLRKFWRKLDVDIISLTETKLNTILLDRNHNIPDKLFQNDVFVVQKSNSTIQLIGKTQQKGVITAVRGKFGQYAKVGEPDQSGLER